MSFPSNLDAFSTKVDGVDTYLASHMNAVQAAIVAVETEIGLGLKGTLADLATRLAVGLNNDGTLKSSALSSLAANTVDTAAIQSQAVTAAKIANATITAAQIANTAITTALLQDGAVTAAKIAGGAVAAANIASGTITSAQVAAGGIVPDNLGLPVWNATGSTLTAGQLVYVSGWNAANSLAQVSLGANNVLGSGQLYIVTATIANGASGTVQRHWTSTASLNTGGSAVGAAVYLDSVAGGWTLTQPTSPSSRQHIVGRVRVVDAAVGQVEFDLVSNNNNVWAAANLPSDVAYLDVAQTFSKPQIVQADADANQALIAKAHSGTQSVTIFEVQGSGGGTRFSVDNSGNLLAIGTAELPGVHIGVFGLSGSTVNNTPLWVGALSLSYASDADLTLSNTQYANTILTANSAVSLTATRKLIVPARMGAFFMVRNLTTGAQSITVIAATGTGVTIANGKAAIVAFDGTNYFRVTADA